MNLTVVGPRVFVRPETLPETTEDGKIVLVHDRQRSTMRGTVVALGDGPVTRTGVVLPHVVEVGNRVIFSPDAGQEVFFEREVLVALQEDDILAVVDDAE